MTRCGKPIFLRTQLINKPYKKEYITDTGPLQCHKQINTQGYTSSKPLIRIYNITPSTHQTTTLTHENYQIHTTTIWTQEKSQQYTQPQLYLCHHYAPSLFFLLFCSMHLCPLFHLHMQPHVGHLFPSLEFSFPLTVVPNHKLAFHSFTISTALFPLVFFPPSAH